MRGLIVVVIDCLRADHVSCYGYGRPTTPTMDQLAGHGMLWERAFSASCWTKPSVATMFTGRYPSEHGAFEGVKRSKTRPAATTDALGDTPTLAEAFRRAGWRTAAFINNAQLGPFSGLDRGFECYQPTAGKADRILEQFASWLDAHLDRPFFAYLHLLEAHWPYKPRRRHMELLGGDRDRNSFSEYSARDYARLGRAVAHGEVDLPSDRLGEMVQMYDGAIRRLDGKIKALRQLLNDRGIADSVGLVVTADHGEEFMEHGRIGHGQSLHDELIHVPLIINAPGVPAGARRRDLVSHVDLARTLADLGEVPSDLPGRNLLDDGPEDAFAIAEMKIRRRYTHMIRNDRIKLIRKFECDGPEGSAADGGPPRDWVNSGACEPRRQAYDLHADPLELRPLPLDGRPPSDVRALEDQLDQWWAFTVCAGQVTGQPAEVELDGEVVRRLRDLGYIE